MLDEHKGRTVALYALSIRVRHKRLLMEKLRRLEAREAQRACTREHGCGCKPACPGKNRAASAVFPNAGGATKEGSFLMIAQEQFDFTHVPDEELYNPDRVFWQGKEAENAAWKAEMERRKEAKRLEQERIAKERCYGLNSMLSRMPFHIVRRSVH